MEIEKIAAVAHDVNRAYCLALGDTGTPMWKHAPAWQRESAVKGVEFYIANPGATLEQSHEEWLQRKLADGWRHGDVKDAERKTHPCCVPYALLPVEQRAKDYIFGAVVRALTEVQP